MHNDLNLENIIISPSGEVKIIDWGESKSSSSAQDKLDEIFNEDTGLYTRICKLLGRATTQDAKAMGARDYTQTLKYLLNRLYDSLGGEMAGIERCTAIGLVEDANNGSGSGGGGGSGGSKKGGGKRKTKRRRKRNKKRYKTRRGKKRNTKRKTKRRVSRRTKRRRKK